MVVSLRLERLFVSFGDRAWEHLQTIGGIIRLRWDEFEAFAQGVAEAPTQTEKDRRIDEGLAYFRSRFPEERVRGVARL